MVVLCADEEWNCSLVEAASLTVPFLDTVESRLACEIEHKEDGHSVIADEGQHVDEFSLAAQIPY